MRPYKMAAGWSEERARELRKAADKARSAYTQGAIRGACVHYADALDAAADLLEGETRELLALDHEGPFKVTRQGGEERDG